MADEAPDWINEKTVGCCLSQAAMAVGVAAASIAAGIAFGPQYGFAVVGAAAFWWGLRFAWRVRKAGKREEAEHGR